jgi:hypothetical protein
VSLVDLSVTLDGTGGDITMALLSGEWRIAE